MAVYTNKNGTTGADTLTYNKNGTYYAYAGSDTINLSGGTVVIYTDGGNNIINVKGGFSHTIKTAADNATADKINGNDKLEIDGVNCVEAYLGSGRDEITISYSDGHKDSGALSLIHGGAWTDTFNINTLARNYQFFGDAGDDVFNINGGSNNIFWGGAANDTFNVEGGENIKLRGGDSADVYNIMCGVRSVDMQLGYGNDVVNIIKGSNATIKANLGINTINLSAGYGHKIISDIDQAASKKAGRDVGYGVDKVYITGASYVFANLGDGKDIVEASFGYGHRIYTEGWGDTIKISGEMAGSLFDSGAGDDIIVVEGGSSNEIYVGEGNDTVTVTGGSVAKVSNGNSGLLKLEVTGGEVKDILVDTGEAEISSASTYASKLTVGSLAGKVTANLGAGNDTAEINNNGSTIAMGCGNDTIVVSGKNHNIYGDYSHWIYYEQDSLAATYKDNITLTDKAVRCSVDAGNGNDTIVVKSEKCIINGGSGNDTITMDSVYSNEIYCDDGDDVIDIDTYAWNNGPVFYSKNAYAKISGGAGNDTFNIHDQYDKYNGGDCIVVFGGSGKDTFNLDCGNVIAYGGNSDDTFNTTTGNRYYGNFMIGGAGNDSYNIDLAHGFYSSYKSFTIDNELYARTSDIDVLRINNFTGSFADISMRMYSDGTKNTYRELMFKDSSGNTVSLRVNGFTTLSRIEVLFTTGSKLVQYGNATEFEALLKSKGQLTSAGISPTNWSNVYRNHYDESAQLAYGTFENFISRDSNLKITGNAF